MNTSFNPAYNYGAMFQTPQAMTPYTHFSSSNTVTPQKTSSVQFGYSGKRLKGLKLGVAMIMATFGIGLDKKENVPEAYGLDGGGDPPDFSNIISIPARTQSQHAMEDAEMAFDKGDIDGALAHIKTSQDHDTSKRFEDERAVEEFFKEIQPEAFQAKLKNDTKKFLSGTIGLDDIKSLDDIPEKSQIKMILRTMLESGDESISAEETTFETLLWFVTDYVESNTLSSTNDQKFKPDFILQKYKQALPAMKQKQDLEPLGIPFLRERLFGGL